VTLQVLDEHVLKEDVGIDLNVSKTTILLKECITRSFTSVRMLVSSTCGMGLLKPGLTWFCTSLMLREVLT
jgi:hypothetical protein